MDLDPEEIAAWAVRMRVRSVDARVLERALVVGRRLVDRVARGPSEAELYDLAAGEPLEAVLAAMTLDGSGVAADRLAHFLDVTRHVRLDIGGADLLELGFSSGPRMGEVLRSVLHLKLNGVITGRDEELTAAARMRETRVNDSSLLYEFLHHLAAPHHQPRAPRTGARLGRLPARRSDGEGARTALAQSHQAPRPWGTIMLAVTFFGSGGSFFFGWAKPVPVDPRFFKDGQRGMAWVGAAGPLTNFALVLRRRRPASGSPTRGVSSSLESFWMLFVLNVILGTLNLIPIPPLDGSRILGGFLPRETYSKWAELDRYGNFVFMGLFLVMIAVPGFYDATFGAVVDRSGISSCRAGDSGDRRTFKWREARRRQLARVARRAA